MLPALSVQTLLLTVLEREYATRSQQRPEFSFGCLKHLNLEVIRTQLVHSGKV